MTSLSKFTAIFLTGFVVLMAAQVGCTKKTEVASVKIVMPNAISAKPAVAKTKSPIVKSNSTSSEEAPEWNTTLNPTVGSEINCFAVFVGGPNLAGNSCAVEDNGANRTITFGPNLGFVPSGSTIRVDVPAGADRVFHIVGLKSGTASACSNYQGKSLDSSNLSEPFLIASQRADVPAGESSLAITASLDLNKKISTCSFVQGPPPGATNTISFGDRRDGKLTLTGANIVNLDAGSDSYNMPATGYSHLPNATGVAPTKYFSSYLRVTNVATTGEGAGKVLTTPVFASERFEAGDEVLWHVSSGNAVPGPPDDPINGACGGDLYLGKFGFAKITNVGGGGTEITLDKSISQNPGLIKNANLVALTSNASGFCRIALTRVPNFDEIDVGVGGTMYFYSAPFDSENGTGGTLVFRAKRIVANGTLALVGSGNGYQGGVPGISAGGSVMGPNGAFGGPSFGSGGGSKSTIGGAGGAGAGEGGSMGAITGAKGGVPISHGVGNTFTALSAGTAHTCGISSDGALRCFGDSTYGQLGAGMQLFSRYSPQLVDSSLTFKSVSSGMQHTCAIGSDDRAYCWGNGLYGKLGDGFATDRFTPVIVPDATAYSQISASATGSHTCAITLATKKLRCWGFNASGQLGDGSTSDRPNPTDIDIAINYKAVSAGALHTCAITDTGVLKCWGDNSESQLGDGSTLPTLTPIVIDSGTSYKRISAGAIHTCGITTLDELRCWGIGGGGRLGVGDSLGRDIPTPVLSGGITYREVSAGSAHSCAVSISNQIRCFGANLYGQIGDNTNVNRETPTVLNSTDVFASVTAGDTHSCGITTTGLPQCWGQGHSGQLGTGDAASVNNLPRNVRNQAITLPLADGKTYFGGGGGAGTSNGAKGGGLVIVMAKEVIGSGSIQATAEGGTGSGGSYASGGGGGGVIGLMSRSLNLSTVNLNSKGGNGSSGSFESAGGGGGIVEIQLCNASSSTFASANVAGGLGVAPSLREGARGIVRRTNVTTLCTAE